MVDRFGRVKLLGFGSAGLCIDLIYSALMAHFFAKSDNKVGKGFAILGIYLFTAIYCASLVSHTVLSKLTVLQMPVSTVPLGFMVLRFYPSSCEAKCMCRAF